MVSKKRIYKKRHSKKRIYKKRNSKKRAKKAGDFVKTGTYGCVFRPPLKCDDNSSELNDKVSAGYVSKLMTSSTFKDEVREVQIISEIFDNMDDDWVKKYFVIPLKKDGCTINVTDPTNEQDIKDSNDNTKHRVPCKFKWSDIETNPRSYKSLNMVDGGHDLEDYLNSNKPLSTSDFNVINTLLVDLLVNGIYEMNNVGIYHFDIKSANIVYNEATGRMRLLDWGFVTHIDRHSINTQPDLVDNILKIKSAGTLYYGAHFGSALLMDNFNDLNKSVNMETPFWNREVSPDINMVFEDYLTPNKLKYMTLLSYYEEHAVLNSIAKHYKAIVNQPKLDFFKNVFLPNTDIFAFLLIYMKISRTLQSSPIKRKINKLIFTYILSDTYSKIPYNIAELAKDLRNLSNSGQSRVRSPRHTSAPDTAISPQTSLLNKKLAENKITQSEYHHLIQMNKDRNRLSISARRSSPTRRVSPAKPTTHLSPLSRWRKTRKAKMRTAHHRK